MLSTLKELNARACFTLFANDRDAVREFVRVVAQQDWRRPETLMLGTCCNGEPSLRVYKTDDGINYFLEPELEAAAIGGVAGSIRRMDSMDSHGTTLIAESDEITGSVRTPTGDSFKTLGGKKERGLRSLFRRKA